MRTYTRRRPEYQEIESVKELCRLCLKKPEESVPIFPENFNNLHSVLAFRIMMCVGFEVTKEDCLPDLICKTCHREIERYYNFRKKCEGSYQKLKYHLLAVKEKQAGRIEDNKLQENILSEVKDSDVLSDNQNLMFTVNLDGSIEISANNRCLNNKDLFFLLNKVGSIVSEPTEGSEQVGIKVPVESSTGVVSSHNNLDSRNEAKISNEDADNVLDMSHCVPAVEVQSTIIESTEMSSEPQIQPDIILHDIDPNNTEGTQIITDISTDGDVKDMPSFLSTMLLQLGMLTQNEDHLELNYETSNIELENGDGSCITFEIVEEDVKTEEATTLPVSREKEKESNKTVMNKVKKQNQALSPGGQWCAFCRKALGSRSALARHLRDVHRRERPHVCALCGKDFAQRNVMTRHMLVHEAKRPHQCPMCPKSFTQRAALTAHQRSHTPPQSRSLHIHQCPECPKVFLHHSGVSRHMRGAHAGRLHWCGQCARSFSDRSSLTRHLKLAKHKRPPTTTAASTADNPS